MQSNLDSTDIKYWVREIETKGLDAVSSILVGKLGTPEAEAIQMAMVEYHKDKDQKKSAHSEQATENARLEGESSDLLRKAVVIASVALGVSCIALLVSVVSFFK